LRLSTFIKEFYDDDDDMITTALVWSDSTALWKFYY